MNTVYMTLRSYKIKICQQNINKNWSIKIYPRNMQTSLQSTKRCLFFINNDLQNYKQNCKIL